MAVATRRSRGEPRASDSPSSVAVKDASRMSGSDRVVAAIVGGILSGRYGPGQKLIEADITQAVGMSRGPVREALKRLDAEGIVTLMRIAAPIYAR